MSYWNINRCAPVAGGHGKRAILSLCALLALLMPMPARADTTLTELAPFSFGLFSLKNNNGAYDLRVDAATNGVTAHANYIIDREPQRGEYRLSGFTPGTEVTVTIDNGGLSLEGMSGTEVFQTVNYTVYPATLIADGAGNIDFYVGATLRSLGNGVTYETGTYRDDLDITFEWIPDFTP